HRGEKTARGTGQGRQKDPPDPEGHVSTYAESRSPHSSSRVLRYTGVDGKPTRSSNRNTGTATSSAAEWVPQLSPFSRDASLFPLPPPSECSAPLHDYAVWTKPTLITSSNGTAMRVLGSPANKQIGR